MKLDSLLCNTPVAVLVQQSQAGNHKAFTVLYHRYYAVVRTIVAKKLAAYRDVDDVVQEVFIRALTKLDQLREPACFGSWLCSIARRLAINYNIRKHGPPLLVEDVSQYDQSRYLVQPIDELFTKERRHQLQKALYRLKPLDFATLAAFYLRDLSLLEMADEFQAPLGTIKRRLHVARKRLRTAYEEVSQTSIN